MSPELLFLGNTFGNVGGALSLIGSILRMFIPFLWIFPILAAGIVLYYFTGEKKIGKPIVDNLMRVSIKIYNFTWIFIGSMLLLIGASMFNDAILVNILPSSDSSGDAVSLEVVEDNVSEDDSENRFSDEEKIQLTYGFFLSMTGVSIVAISYFLNNKVLTKTEKKGTLITKFYATLGLVIYSIIGVTSLLSFKFNLTSYIFDTTETIASGPLALTIAALPILAVYAAYSYRIFLKENSS